jgi:hypothetical protein
VKLDGLYPNKFQGATKHWKKIIRQEANFTPRAIKQDKKKRSKKKGAKKKKPTNIPVPCKRLFPPEVSI